MADKVKIPKRVVRKVRKSGFVKLKPQIIGDRPKDMSLIAEHIAEATGKAKEVEKNVFIRAYIYIGNSWNNFINKMFGM